MLESLRKRLLLAGATIVAVCLASCSHKTPADHADDLANEELTPARTVEATPADDNLPRYNARIKVNNIGRLSDVFNDSNRYHYDIAKRLGIEPITDLSKAWNTRRPLVHITSNDHYLVDSLVHSLPFLVPEAAALLDTIGRNFIDSLHQRGGDGYTIKVTSLLRTPSTVKRLRRVNVNASDSSTHQFGTTFDLSYVKFNCLNPNRTIHDGDLKNLLAEVLLDLRMQNRCLVKYERKTGCFHITVNDAAKRR